MEKDTLSFAMELYGDGELLFAVVGEMWQVDQEM